MILTHYKNEEDFLLNVGPAVVFRFGVSDGLPVEYISNNFIQFGYLPDEFQSKNYKFEDIIFKGDLDRVREAFRTHTQSPDLPGLTLVYRIYTKDGSVRWIEQRTTNVRDVDGCVKWFYGLFFDVTERREAEDRAKLELERQNVLLRLNYMGSCPFQEIVDYVREEAVRLTKSRVGYIAFPTPDESTLIMHSWSHSSVRLCSIDVKNRLRVYPLHKTGLWGEAVRQRKPMIVNDFSTVAHLRKGFPEGHVTLIRYMHVPIFDGDRIVIVVGVGNKDSDYNETDLLHLTLLMQGAWDLLQKRRIYKTLKNNFEELFAHYERMESVSVIPHEFMTDVSDDGFCDDDGYLALMEKEVFLESSRQQQKLISEGLTIMMRLKHLVDSLYYLHIGNYAASASNSNPVDIRSLCESTNLKSIHKIHQKALTLDVDLPSDFPSVMGCRADLDMAFTALVEYACHRSPAGGTILINGDVSDGFVRIRICDFGATPDEVTLLHLFRSITHIESDHVHADFREGAESGLYVAKAIISGHNGSVECLKNPKGGLIFLVKLPVADACSDEVVV